MKSLVPWVCLFAASASYQVYADKEFNAYRLGNYTTALEPLMNKSNTDAVANYYLGRMYLYGYGQLKNNELAMHYFTKAAEQGYLPAIQLMAKYTLIQDKNPEQAAYWFKQAANKGDINAQLFMGAASMYGLGVKKNMDSASHYFIDAAKQGNALAQYAVAESFLASRHAANKKLGAIWLAKSAAKGNLKAMTDLGVMYLKGSVVNKDTSKGLDWLQQAAARNYLPAMWALAEQALADKNSALALDWYNKAAATQDPKAYLVFAQAYQQEKSPIYDPKSAFLWTLKAAQADYLPAKQELISYYQKGIGVEANAALAEEWTTNVNESIKKQAALSSLEQVALWLSNGTTDQLEKTNYQLGGIFNDWSNTSTLANNRYNQAPQLEQMTHQDIFKPQLVFMQPNDVSIATYYDVLSGDSLKTRASEWSYPVYPLNPQLAALERIYSNVLTHDYLPAPYLDACYENSMAETPDLLALWTTGWQKQANYSTVFNQLYSRAILGDPQAQFEIGQMFQYGIGISKNDDAATVFYQNAAEQQHLGAEYNLGILSLQRAQDASGYTSALNWLNDSAYKGNDKAQYVLAHLLAQGQKNSEGQELIKTNPKQALSMLYLSAANEFGPAQYELANVLSAEGTQGLPLKAKNQKLSLIRELYSGAVHGGVVQAMLPLAFYNAMETSKTHQQAAYQVAATLANEGNEKAALLLGLLYDRGIGVSADANKAMYWYQQAGNNPVSAFILGTSMLEGKGIALNIEKGKDLLAHSASAFPFADFNLAVLDYKENKPFLPRLIKSYELGANHAGIVLADYYIAQSNQSSDADRLAKARQIYAGLAEKGDSVAQLKLAYILAQGIGLAPDPFAALQWYVASAEQGNVLGQYLLGQFYLLGEAGAPDYPQAIAWYQKASKELPQASAALGFLYETVDDNYAKALKAYEQAADRGDAYGYYNLALMYEYGKGMPVNYAKAKTLFAAAADRGVSEAMSQMAHLYFYGLGEAKNDQLALDWYKKAAALGNADALYCLGLMSETGVATKLDFAKALNYYEKAAAQNNEKAMLALARMYQYGLGVNKDLEQAMQWYQQLAMRQNAYAQYQLGHYYLTQNANQLSDKARQWLMQASKNGSTQANQLLQRLEAAQGRISFIEAVHMNSTPVLKDPSVDRVYLDALNEWNLGDEMTSRMLLQRLVTQYPDFIPARRTYEQINQVALQHSLS